MASNVATPPSPRYSPTDVGLAVVNVVLILLDVLSYYGKIPALEPGDRATLSTSLTVIISVGMAALVYNRVGKHQARATMLAAGALPSAPPPIQK